jgi:hypothetical protein
METAPPTDLATDLVRHLTESCRRATHDSLGRERSRAAAHILARTLHRVAEHTMTAMAGMQPTARAIACRRGCDACCRVPEATTDVPTLLLLADRTPQPTDDGTACVLLAEGACSVHADRPIACRAYNAFDAGPCASGRFAIEPASAALDPSLGDPWPFLIGAAVMDGVVKGLVEIGLDGRQVRLSAGLRLLAREPSLADRWLAGDAAFAAITISPP